VQHSTDQEPKIRQNPRFADRSGSGNPDCHVNRPDVLHDREELSRRLEQTEEHVMMVGSWPCKLSSEMHTNGQCVSEPVQEDKGKAMVPVSEDEKDPRRAHMVLSKGREVIGPGYSRLSGDAARAGTEEKSRVTLARLAEFTENTTQIGRRIGLLRTARITGMDTQVSG
jgi:hypothetical protein